jgi:phospholipase C
MACDALCFQKIIPTLRHRDPPMNFSTHSGFARIRILAALCGLACLSQPAQSAVSYIGDVIIPGDGVDHSGLPAILLEDGVSPQNALNGFGSGLAYAGGNIFYALSDRGPNKVAYSGGAAVDNTTSFANRYQQFTLNFTPVGSPDGSGHYASYAINAVNTGTTLLKNLQGVQYTGISTGIANGLRFDCEGIRVAPDGTVWISDEYGPLLYHFNRQGQQIGSLTMPAGFVIANPGNNITVETANNNLGRVTNKGMEGLAISPDGKTLVGVMQSPLIQDGGVNGLNVRIVFYDLSNPTAAPKQYLYSLDSTAMSISEILAVNNHKFLVDERNASAGAAGVKKLYQFDLNQASAPTDLATSAYPGTTTANGLPATGIPSGIVALQKTQFADIGTILKTASPSPFTAANGTDGLPDKIEGYCWGPDLPDGRRLLLASNDNDFVRPGGAAGAGFPNYFFAFAVDNADVADFQQESFDSVAAVDTIDHIVVVYQENWTFDGLYGSFPGANGYASASAASLAQIDRLTGNPLSSEGPNSYSNPAFASLTTNPPPPLTTDSASGVADTRIAAGTNTLLPYGLGSYIDPTMTTGDIYHRYWQEQFQIYGAVVDPVHGFSETGNNSGFVSWSDNPGLVLSHYDATNLPEGILAQQYTICDNFFHSAFGGSFLNHQFLIAAQAPVYTNMPVANNGNIAYLDANGVFVMNTSGTAAGRFVRDGSVTPVPGDQITVTINGVSTPVTLTAANAQAYAGTVSATFDKHYVVNTTRSVNLGGNGENGFPGNGTAPIITLLPSQNDSNPGNASGDLRPFIPTIGDLLSMADVSWKWYSGGWSQILAYSGSNPAPTTSPSYASVNAVNQFQYHHQPFAYYDNYAPFDTTRVVPASMVGGFAGGGTGGLTYGQGSVTPAQNAAAHLQDETAFFADVAANTLPAVVFVKPVGVNNEHPGYATLQNGQAHVASIVQAIQANPALWAHTAIIITYDEHGGRWDHVTPPTNDIWGPGARVPCIVISPLVKKGYVDHAAHDTSSILATIERRFDLPALTPRDAAASTLFSAFTSLDISRGTFAINRRTNKVSQTVTITNLSSTAITGPIQLVLDSLSSNTALTNSNGSTVSNAPAGSPYITVSNGGLAPGAAATVTLQFNLPASGGVSYSARTVTGTTAP